jgi:hypothetical protein
VLKKFTVPSRFGAEEAPFAIYVGRPVDDAHPLEQQAAWLLRERGGVLPPEVMDAFAELHNVALENEVLFEELAVFALGTNSDSDVPVNKSTWDARLRRSGIGLAKRLPGRRQHGE